MGVSMNPLLGLLLSVGLLLAGVSAGGADVPLIFPNASFEEWAALPQEEPLWDLRDRSFPTGWTPESYKGRPSLARPALNAPEDVGERGQRCLYLDGQIASAKLCAPLPTSLNRTVLLTVRAGGAGGHVRAAVRAYGWPPTEPLFYQTELLNADTEERWRT